MSFKVGQSQAAPGLSLFNKDLYDSINDVEKFKNFLKMNPLTIHDKDLAFNHTILHLVCAISESLDVIKCIVDSGMDINACNIKGDSALSVLLQRKQENISGETTIMIHKAIVFLLERGASPKLNSIEAEDQLMIALLKEWAHPDFMKLVKALWEQRTHQYFATPETKNNIKNFIIFIPDLSIKDYLQSLFEPSETGASEKFMAHVNENRAYQLRLHYSAICLEAQQASKKFLGLKYQENELSELEIKLSPLIEADRTKNTSIIKKAIDDAIATHQICFQTIEAWLRKNYCHSFIVPFIVAGDQSVFTIFLNREQVVDAFKGSSESSSSYKENFLKLRELQPLTYNSEFSNSFDFKDLANACKEGDLLFIEEVLKRNPAWIDGKDSDANTPLLIACEAMQYDVVYRLLLNIGVSDLNAKNIKNECALLILANNYKKNPLR